MASLAALLPLSALSAAENSIVVESAEHRIKVSTLVDGLETPWAMAILPGGDILVTEQPGRLRP